MTLESFVDDFIRTLKRQLNKLEQHMPTYTTRTIENVMQVAEFVGDHKMDLFEISLLNQKIMSSMMDSSGLINQKRRNLSSSLPFSPCSSSFFPH